MYLNNSSGEGSIYVVKASSSGGYRKPFWNWDSDRNSLNDYNWESRAIGAISIDDRVSKKMIEIPITSYVKEAITSKKKLRSYFRHQ